MKYHCRDGDLSTSLCGLVNDRPDTFLYALEQFLGHNNKEMRCKICNGILFFQYLADAGEHIRDMDYPTGAIFGDFTRKQKDL